MKKIISTLLIILIFSCAGENNPEEKNETKFIGFYDYETGEKGFPEFEMQKL